MQGLDEIRNRVIEQAERQAKVILADAERWRTDALERSRLDETERSIALDQEMELSAEREERRTRSTATLERRNALLRTRRGLIEEVKQKALDQLAEIPEHRRYSYIHAVIEKYAIGGETVLLNAQDQGLFRRLQQASEVEIHAATEPANIRGGVILLQNERRLDFSFDKLFETEEEVLTEQIAQDLWGEA